MTHDIVYMLIKRWIDQGYDADVSSIVAEYDSLSPDDKLLFQLRLDKVLRFCPPRVDADRLRRLAEEKFPVQSQLPTG